MFVVIHPCVCRQSPLCLSSIALVFVVNHTVFVVNHPCVSRQSPLCLSSMTVPWLLVVPRLLRIQVHQNRGGLEIKLRSSKEGAPVFFSLKKIPVLLHPFLHNLNYGRSLNPGKSQSSHIPGLEEGINFF